MGRSATVRLADVRQLMQIVRNLYELPDDPAVRSAFLVTEACRFFSARSGMIGLMRPTPIDGMPVIQFAVPGGWLDPRTTQLYEQYAHERHMQDLLLVDVMGHANRTGVFNRDGRVADQSWYRSPHYNEMRKALGIDDPLYGLRAIAPTGVVAGLGINREIRGRRFNQRELRLFEILHDALTPFYHDLTQSVDASARVALPRRTTEVLRGLLAGYSEKQIALRLNLSPHTVHDHVKLIYKRMGVTSRAELLLAARSTGKTISPPEKPTRSGNTTLPEKSTLSENPTLPEKSTQKEKSAFPENPPRLETPPAPGDTCPTCGHPIHRGDTAN